MIASNCAEKISRKAHSASKAALGRYLAAGLGATGLATADCEAGIVNLNIASLGTTAQDLTGINGGVVGDTPKTVQNITGSASSFLVYNSVNPNIYLGFGPGSNVAFLASSALDNASPTNLSNGTFVGTTAPSGSAWTTYRNPVLFQFYEYTATNFGPGSYIGFRVQDGGNYNYGYFNVTWDSTQSQFQILSGAYESTPNTAIAVPEPATVALAGIGALALGVGAIRRSRRGRKAAAEGAVAEAV